MKLSCINCEMVTENPKFCSKSCAAIYNNARRSNISRSRQRISLKSTLKRNKLHYTKVKYSPITNKPYNPSLNPAINWDNPKRLPTARILAKAFRFNLLSKDTRLKLEESVTYLEKAYHEYKLSSKEIQFLLNIKHSEFSVFLKSLNINLRSLNDAIKKKFRNNHHKSQKQIYWDLCKFKFPSSDYHKIKGFSKLKEIGWYHKIKNPNGLVRDHMFSKSEGFKNNIDTKIISHPANCEFLTFQENNTKNKKCSLSLDNLIQIIENWCL